MDLSKIKDAENDYASDEEQIMKAQEKMRRDVNQAIQQKLDLDKALKYAGQSRVRGADGQFLT